MLTLLLFPIRNFSIIKCQYKKMHSSSRSQILQRFVTVTEETRRDSEKQRLHWQSAAGRYWNIAMPQRQAALNTGA